MMLWRTFAFVSVIPDYCINIHPKLWKFQKTSKAMSTARDVVYIWRRLEPYLGTE